MSGTQISDNSYDNLMVQIGLALSEGRKSAAKTVNSILVQTYWTIGKYIVEFEQDGKEHAKYGDELLLRLSRDLTIKYGKGFSRSNLTYIRKLYRTFPKCETLSHILSWSHYFEILKLDTDLEINFYIRQCEIENWSVRELKRQMKSMLFHRLALSKNKEEIIKLSKEGQQLQTPKDIIKDNYVLEFLGLPEREEYKEGDVENRIIENLQHFLLELGRGFAFIGRQYKLQIGARQFRVDLVFYNHILKCFVLIDIKRGEIEHYDVGQMNMYLNYFKNEQNSEGDNLPIGIVLGAYKDQLLMEYATQGIENNLFVSKYQLYLPNKEELQLQLEKLLISDC